MINKLVCAKLDIHLSIAYIPIPGYFTIKPLHNSASSFLVASVNVKGVDADNLHNEP